MKPALHFTITVVMLATCIASFFCIFSCRTTQEQVFVISTFYLSGVIAVMAADQFDKQ